MANDNNDDFSISIETTPLVSKEDMLSTRTIRPLPGMRIRSHAIAKDGTLDTYSTKQALSGSKKGKGHFWIDIDADDRDVQELSDWLDQLKLPSFFLSRLAEPHENWASQVLAFPSSFLAVIRVLPEKPTSDDIVHIAALCIPNLLLTFTSCPRSDVGGLYRSAHPYVSQRLVPSPNSSGAFFAWLLFHVERTSQTTRELRSCILKMDETMDRDITLVEIEEVIDAKDQVLRVLSVAEEQTECLQALAGAEIDTLSPDLSQLRGTLNVLLAVAGSTERTALRLEKHVSDLRQRYDAHQQERINRRLAVLTVISAIFLPLTLITGIWGMNFEYMPELQSHDAYFIALFAMVGIATSMIFYFWQSGWFE